MEVNRKSQPCGAENLYLWFQSSLSRTSPMPSENSKVLSLTFGVGLCKELPVWHKHINRKWKEAGASGDKYSRLGCCVQVAVASSVHGMWKGVEELDLWSLCSLSDWLGEWATGKSLLSASVYSGKVPIPCLCAQPLRRAGCGSRVRDPDEAPRRKGDYESWRVFVNITILEEQYSCIKCLLGDEWLRGCCSFQAALGNACVQSQPGVNNYLPVADLLPLTSIFMFMLILMKILFPLYDFSLYVI